MQQGKVHRPQGGDELIVAAGGKITVEAAGAIVDANGPLVHHLRLRVTAAQVNAGHTLLPAIAGYKYRLVDLSLIAIGGNAGGATGVLVRGTLGTARTLMDAKAGGLTQSTLLRIGTATNGLILADGASFTANDAGTAITIIKDGSDLTTATHIDVLLSYVIEE